MRSRIRIAALCSLFVFVPYLTSMQGVGRVFASDGENAAPSLAGLQGITVMILPVSPDAERNGLKREQIQTDVELKLRKGGIKLLTERELEKPGFPYLNIDLNVAKDKNPELYAYGIKVEMYKQEIQNPQDEIETAMQSVSVKTWSSEQAGTAPGSDLKNRVHEQMGSLLDKFIKDYLTANPKK